MAKRAISAVLSGALALGAFLCLGMGMEMGAGFAQAPGHDCCPAGTPAEDSSAPNCCLLMPGAGSSSVIIPGPVLTAFLISSIRTALVVPVITARARSHGPPGRTLPGYVPPTAPRAPPAA